MSKGKAHQTISMLFEQTSRERPKSKAQKAQRFQNCKRGDYSGFFKHPFCCEIERVTFWCNPKIVEQSLIVPKTIQMKNTKIAKGGSFVCFRGRFFVFHFMFQVNGPARKVLQNVNQSKARTNKMR